jgi:DNA primase
VVSNLGLVRRLSPNVIIAFDSDAAGRKAAMRAAAIGLSMGMDVKIADLVGGKDPADLVLHDPEDWKKALREAKPIIEFELGNVLRDEPDPRKTPRALRERVLPFLARIESAMDKAHFVKKIADDARIAEDAVWQDLWAIEEKLKQSIQGQTSGNVLPKSDLGIRVASTRLDLVERRMFGLLHLLESIQSPKVPEYHEQIKLIAGASYDERVQRIQTLLGDVVFEAESFYGNEKDRWDFHMIDLMSIFEEDLINAELVSTMQDLKSAEKAGDGAQVAVLAQKCQDLSTRKAAVAKKRKG